ncbi:MAG: uridine kinase [Fidelibacterota bacterium]|nr:MAG: uridine kinase [Candidatus Neomarinimicrobiota bacterium]
MIPIPKHSPRHNYYHFHLTSNSSKSTAVLIGIAGGTGSGKTSIAKALMKELGREEVVVLEQDSYYHDLGHLIPEDRMRVNFDHPDSVDFRRMQQDLEALLEGESVEVPIYDYTAHTRKKETRHISGHRLIILEGILVLADQEVRDLMDIKIYVDTPDDVRFIRRMTRDVKNRGRSFESVVDQYYKTVRPMHLQFVEPTKRYADIIFPEGAHNRVAIDILKTKINALLGEGQTKGEVIPT